MEENEVAGEGNYARVYNLDSETVVKVIPKENLLSGIREAILLNKCKEMPGIVNIKSVEINNDGIRLTLDKCEINLYNFIKDNKLPLNGLIKLFREIMLAIYQVHSSGIIHCDIKPQNIMLKHDRPYLIDFGISIPADNIVHHCLLQTPTFRAPEIGGNYRQKNVSEKVDVWSAGCILYFMLTQKPLFEWDEIGDSSIYASKLFGIPYVTPRSRRLKILMDQPFDKVEKSIKNRVQNNTTYNGFQLNYIITMLAKMLNPNYKYRLTSREVVIILDNFLVMETPQYMVTKTNFINHEVIEGFPDELISLIRKDQLNTAEAVYQKYKKQNYIMADVKLACIYVTTILYDAPKLKNYISENYTDLMDKTINLLKIIDWTI